MGLQLGLDISTSNVGWCLLEKETGQFVDAGALELSKKKDIFEKSDVVRKALKELNKKFA